MLIRKEQAGALVAGRPFMPLLPLPEADIELADKSLLVYSFPIGSAVNLPAVYFADYLSVSGGPGLSVSPGKSLRVRPPLK